MCKLGMGGGGGNKKKKTNSAEICEVHAPGFPQDLPVGSDVEFIRPA